MLPSPRPTGLTVPEDDRADQAGQILTLEVRTYSTRSPSETHVGVTSLGGAHRVDIIDRDRVGLFADTAGLLAAHGFVVRSALVGRSMGWPSTSGRSTRPVAIGPCW